MFMELKTKSANQEREATAGPSPLAGAVAGLLLGFAVYLARRLTDEGVGAIGRYFLWGRQHRRDFPDRAACGSSAGRGAWLVETDVMAERGQPILSLVSRVFLRDRERIIEQLTRTGHGALLYYMLQQVQQFRSLGEDFAMQHKDSEYLGEVEEELQTAVLEAIPVERRLRGLTPEELLRVLSPEEMVRGLSKEQAARLRELLERGQGT